VSGSVFSQSWALEAKFAVVSYRRKFKTLLYLANYVLRGLS
jgi:hypothetical protein